jgi:hypothetical protein
MSFSIRLINKGEAELIKKLKPAFIFTFVIVCYSTLVAANIPESHRYTNSEKKLDLFTGSTGWDFFTGDAVTQNSTDLQLFFVARAPKAQTSGAQSTLTMRVDKSDSRTSRLYAMKWLKEYPKFGYELQMSREASYGTLEGFEIELKSTQSDRHIRQFLVKHASEMWVFTCSSDQAHFDSVSKDCEKILKTSKTIL